MKIQQRRAINEIRQTRKELRVSQGEFAEIMHVCRGTVFAWETGRRNPLGGKGELLSIWWRGPIKAAMIANRIFQAAFRDV